MIREIIWKCGACGDLQTTAPGDLGVAMRMLSTVCKVCEKATYRLEGHIKDRLGEEAGCNGPTRNGEVPPAVGETLGRATPAVYQFAARLADTIAPSRLVDFYEADPALNETYNRQKRHWTEGNWCAEVVVKGAVSIAHIWLCGPRDDRIFIDDIHAAPYSLGKEPELLLIFWLSGRVMRAE